MDELYGSQTPQPDDEALKELRKLARQRRMLDGWVVTAVVLCAVAAVASVPAVLVTTIDWADVPLGLILGLAWPCAGGWFLTAVGLGLRHSLKEKTRSLCHRAQLSRGEFFDLAASDPELGADERFLRLLDRRLARERRRRNQTAGRAAVH